jgi:Ca-activated chloride channel family protein
MAGRVFNRLIIAIIAAAAMFAGAARADENAMLVLDASGSMWGQVGGEAKIVIAKRVLGKVLADLPADRHIGLIAYGHRREGDCADIEEIAPVGADRAAISAAVEKINPKGKTPMADSVKLAAEKLRYTDEKATVILISDGVETCEPDPCGVAAALERAGVDLTVHVVGFDVAEENAQAQLRCIAENTGGEFVPAANADELGAALKTTVVERPAATAANLYLRATELEGGPEIETGLDWIVRPAGGGDPIISETNAGRVEATAPPGTYDVEVVRPSDGLKGEIKGVVIKGGASKTVTIALEFPLSASVAAEPAGAGVAGTNIKVRWTGPDRRGDFISVAEKGSRDSDYATYAYARAGNPADVRLPVEPGAYEIRYVLGAPYRVLARIDYQVNPASATLSAPDTAVAGSEVSVAFTGPAANSGDYITITRPDDPDTAYTSYAYTRNGSPAKLRMPLEPGDYEFRFVQNNTKVLARKAVAVTKAEATLSAPEEAGAGETVKVEFTGPPAGSGDYITVTAPDAPGKDYTDYAYTRNGSPAEIRMPLEAGEYEIRYVQGGKKVIARQAIRVVEVAASVSAKSTAVAGETVSVVFTGPAAGQGDFITVTAPDAPDSAYLDYAYTRNGSPAKIRMPLDAGTYEIRFVQGNSKVIARQTIVVTAATATLSAPSQATAGSTISVEFTGPPPGQGDFITITKPDDPDTAYMDYAYTRNGSPAKIRTPETPGDYQLRFVQGDKKVLARRPIKVIAAQ